MLRFLLRRTLTIIPLTLVMAVMMFFLMRLLPGDPALNILGPEATPEEIETLKIEMCLDQPVYYQLANWLGGIVTGDLGKSFYHDMPVSKMLFTALIPTLKLTLLSLLFGILIGTGAGVISAIKQDSLVDRIIVVISTSFMAVPHMWLGLLLVLLFGVVLGWLPVAGYESFKDGGVVSLKYLILPILAMSTAEIGILTKMVRARMLDVLHQDYVLTAKSKGLPFWKVILKHAFKNTLITVVTLSGMMLAGLIGGAVITENIFAIPGMGRLIVTSIVRRDYLVVQSAIMLITFLYLFLNFLVDIIYAFLDPRVSYGSLKG
ncbi:MAG: ABC transporter permease [Deltaproteobacteria bacterium]|nr:ABC transporter permease [Deltaproteobacteria bacterium]